MSSYVTQLRAQTRFNETVVHSFILFMSSTNSNYLIKLLNQIKIFRSKLLVKDLLLIRLYFKNKNSLSADIRN